MPKPIPNRQPIKSEDDEPASYIHYPAEYYITLEPDGEPYTIGIYKKFDPDSFSIPEPLRSKIVKALNG